MGADRFDHLFQPLSKGDLLGKALSPDRLNAMIELLQDAVRGKHFRGGPGILMRSGAQGVQFRTRRQLEPTRPPKPLEVLTDGTVVPSTIGGYMPKIGGVRLDAANPPNLTINTSGAYYVKVKVTGTLTINTYAGQSAVGAFLPDSEVTILGSSTSPSGGALHSSDGTFEFLLATFHDGVKTGQVGFGPVDFVIQDSLNGDGVGRMNLGWSNYI